MPANPNDYEAKELVATVNDKDLSPERSPYFDQVMKAVESETYGGEVKTAALNTAQLESTTNSALLSETQMRKIYPYATQLVNPLSFDFLARVHDNIRREGAPRRCLKTIVGFALGKRPKPVLDTKEEYYYEEDKKAALKEIQDWEPNRQVLVQLMEIDKTCNARRAWKSLLFLGMGFGRAVCVKQYNNEQLPINLITLASLRLGNVWVDRRDWKFLGVEYLDYNSANRILQAKHIVHFEYDDIPLTPNARYFGMPLFEGLTALIESNRITSEVVIPELSKKAFAPQQIIVVPDAKSTDKLNEIANLIVPGKTTVLRKMIEVKTIELVVDILMQTKKIEDVDQKVFRDAQVPLGIGFPNMPNKATIDEELNQWEEGPLEDIRSDFRDVIEPQWYEPNAKQITVNQGINRDDNPLASLWAQPFTAQPQVNPYVQSLDKVELAYKVNMVFTNIEIEGMVNRAAAVIGYKNAGIIDEEIALELANLEQYKDKMREKRLNNVFNNQAFIAQAFENEKAGLEQATTNIDQSLQGHFPKTGLSVDAADKGDSKLRGAFEKLSFSKKGGAQAKVAGTVLPYDTGSLTKLIGDIVNNRAISLKRMQLLGLLETKIREL